MGKKSPFSTLSAETLINIYIKNISIYMHCTVLMQFSVLRSLKCLGDKPNRILCQTNIKIRGYLVSFCCFCFGLAKLIFKLTIRRVSYCTTRSTMERVSKISFPNNCQADILLYNSGHFWNETTIPICNTDIFCSNTEKLQRKLNNDIPRERGMFKSE